MISRTKKVKLSNVLSISSGLWMNEMAAIDIVSWFGFWPIFLQSRRLIWIAVKKTNIEIMQISQIGKKVDVEVFLLRNVNPGFGYGHWILQYKMINFHYLACGTIH